MKKTVEQCQYTDPEGMSCPNKAESEGFCFWHNKSIDKSGKQIKSTLENYARNKGFLRGICLAHANLQHIDLVNHHNKQGYDFSYSDFYHANLNNAHLFNINLSYTSLMKADLRDANLNCANLLQTNLLGAKWSGCKFENITIGKDLVQELNAKAALKGKNKKLADDYFQQAEEIYRDLRKHAEQEGIFTLSGNFIKKELTMRRMQLPIFSLKRITSKIVDLFCGYGEAPLRIVGLSIFIIVCCAFLYTFTGIDYRGEVLAFNSQASINENISLFFSCLYYSVVTFTTLGYGDITPVGISRAIAAAEAFTGSFTIALFVVVFVKKMTR
jgi:hypothetical protein